VRQLAPVCRVAAGSAAALTVNAAPPACLWLLRCRFYDLIQPDHVYIMSGGRVQPSKKQFTSIRHEYEISFDEKSTVSPCSDDARIARIMYNFVKLDQLPLVDVNKTVDVIGIVRDPGNPTSLTVRAARHWPCTAAWGRGDHRLGWPANVYWLQR